MSANPSTQWEAIEAVFDQIVKELRHEGLPRLATRVDQLKSSIECAHIRDAAPMPEILLEGYSLAVSALRINRDYFKLIGITELSAGESMPQLENKYLLRRGNVERGMAFHARDFNDKALDAIEGKPQ